jgi:hypothetical protein
MYARQKIYFFVRYAATENISLVINDCVSKTHVQHESNDFFFFSSRLVLCITNYTPILAELRSITDIYRPEGPQQFTSETFM